MYCSNLTEIPFFPVVRSESPAVGWTWSRELNMVCCFYSNLSYLHISVRHIRLQHTSAVMDTVVYDDQCVAHFYKFASIANRTQDPSCTLFKQNMQFSSFAQTPTERITLKQKERNTLHREKSTL